MTDSRLDEILTSIRETREDVTICKNELIEANIGYIAYFYSRVLLLSDVDSVLNQTFEKLFSIISKNEEIDSSNFLYNLNSILLKNCDEQLKTIDVNYSNWEIEHDIEEELVDDNSISVTDNQVLFSDRVTGNILEMVKNLQSNERFVAYSYFYLNVEEEQISNDINVDNDTIHKYIKSINFDIEANLRYLFKKDYVPFNKQTISSYFYMDYNQFTQNKMGGIKDNFMAAQTKDQISLNEVMQKKTKNELANSENTYHKQPEPTSQTKKAIRKRRRERSITAKNKPLLIILFCIMITAIIASGLYFLYVYVIDKKPEEIPVVDVTDISISPDTIYIFKNEKVNLTVSITPYDTTYKDITNIIEFVSGETVIDENTYWGYQISDPIIKYDANTQSIIGLEPGTTGFKIVSLRCETQDGELIEDIVYVTVLEDALDLGIEDDSIEIYVGTEFTFDTTVVNNKTVSYALSNDKVLQIEGNKVTAKETGECTIFATTYYTDKNGKPITLSKVLNVKVVIPDVPVESISTEEDKITIEEGEKTKLSFNILPEDCTHMDMTKIAEFDPDAPIDNNIDWYYLITDEDVISYNPYKQEVTGLRKGSSIITFVSSKYLADDGQSISCSILFTVVEKGSLEETTTNTTNEETTSTESEETTSTDVNEETTSTEVNEETTSTETNEETTSPEVNEETTSTEINESPIPLS